MALSQKQAAFIDEYLIDFNATQAAIRAGYAERGARVQGHRMLTDANIVEEIEKRVSERTMSADEALLRLAEQARADYSQYLVSESIYDDDGNLEAVRQGVDLTRMIEDGKAHLIKAIKKTQAGTNIEFHDAQSALFKIADVHGLTKQQLEHSGNVNINVADLSDEELEEIISAED